ncbi:MAG TPA: ferritin [Bdellovibrionales bacterium]|nr:MAG: hypothetical protein A2Z97_13845 [Bdellovibrionales bacterium GWB1_52_6]OFZ06385.1 MAG: hypothetical protein A2X97_02895 [Bdellovibrionales bacterium GWA1_52_35]OFZ39966.1 MAG: hypothetical protein A2070_07950 [Bdellovibrionales bacterium GWC1_52_8]HAR42860.1 ferritin [Bdellovibrionales bacterium]HCM40140.1 ferritin [Bdellovibrionales bacterium]
MDNEKIIKELHALRQLDIDAVNAYDEAIKKISNLEVSEQLASFKLDHERHISDLGIALQKLGDTSWADRKADLKGLLIEGFTKLRSSTGTEGALKAMRMNEQLTNRNYKDAHALDFPADIRSLIAANYEDEKRHLKYIEGAIDNEAWEQKHVA